MDNFYKLVTIAKNKISNPDVIVNGYDLTLEWISPKLSKIIGYDEAEIREKQTIALHSDSPEQARQTEMAILTTDNKIIKEISVKTKNNELVNIKFNICHFSFEEDPFMVGRILDWSQA